VSQTVRTKVLTEREARSHRRGGAVVDFDNLELLEDIF